MKTFDRLGAASGALLLVASVLPWATYRGFPGQMKVAGVGGVRLYVLLLALAAVLFVKHVPGRVKALRAAGSLALAISLVTLLCIGYAGGGLVNVGLGAWLAVVGALGVVVSAFLLDPAAEPEAGTPELPADASWRPWAELLITVAVVGLALVVFVVGLGIKTSNIANGDDHKLRDVLSLNDLTNESQFLGFLLFVVGVVATLTRLGLTRAIGRITQAHQQVLLGAALVAALVFPFTQTNGYAMRIAASIGVFAAAAIGLNIVVGLAGLLDLGYIAFFGVGAYFAAITSGTTTSPHQVHIPFFFVVVLGALIAGFFGVVLGAPTLRLRGDYLAIVTLGFGEIFRITVLNLDGFSGPSLTGGPNGISAVPDLKLGGFDFGADHTVFGITLPFQANYYWLEVILIIGVMTAFLRLSESRIGRAWVAIREDELAAAATGINTTRLKLLAFALGATLAGAAGTVNAHVVKVAAPDSFTFLESALLLAAVILGGMGTVPGALLGATVLYLLPEKLRFLQDLRLLVFGIVLVLIMRLRPEGLVPSKRRQREFHDHAGGADSLGGAIGGPTQGEPA